MAKVKAKAKTVSDKAGSSAPRARHTAAKKATFLAKVKASSSSKSPLGLSKSSGIQKKRKSKKETTSIALGTMGDLSVSLLEASRGTTTNNKQPGASLVTQKARHQVLKQEAPRLASVIQHPKFKLDPIAAIKNHLDAVLPDKPKAPSHHHRHKGEQEKKQQRREKKKRRRAVGNDSTAIMTY